MIGGYGFFLSIFASGVLLLSGNVLYLWRKPFYYDSMETVLLIILFLLLGVVFLVVPVVTLLKLLAVSRTVDELQLSNDIISNRLDAIQNSLSEAAPDAQATPAEDAAPCEPAMPVDPPPFHGLPADVPAPISAPEPEPWYRSWQDYEPAPASETIVDPGRERRRNFEKLVGENLLSKIGILALIVGIGFFVKFAIDNDWVDEVGRTILGLVAGCGLWVIAWFLRDKYRSFASVLAGGGFAVCFVTVALAYNFYHIFSAPATFAILVGLTAFIIFVAMRFDRRELASVGILGGFIAPFLCASDAGSCATLFGYITLLNAGIAFVTLRRDWWELAAAGCALTWIAVAVYRFAEPATLGRSAWMLSFSTIFVMLFSMPLATVLSHDRKKSTLTFVLIVASVVNFVAYLLAGLYYIDHIPLLGHFRGAISFVLTGISLFLFGLFYRSSDDNFMQNLLLGAVVVCAALIFPIQFSDPSVITIGLATLAVAYTGVYARTRRSLFGWASVLLGAIVFLRLLNSLNSYATDPTSLSIGITYAVSGLCYVAMAFIISRYVLARSADISQRALWSYRVALWTGIAIVCGASSFLAEQSHTGLTGDTAVMATLMASLLLVTLSARRSDDAGWLVPGLGALAFIIFGDSVDRSSVVCETVEWAGAALFVATAILQGRRIFGGRAPRGIFGSDGFAVYYTLSGTAFIIAAITTALYCASLTKYYSAGVSIGLIVCGALAMAAGMKYRCRVERIVSLGLFGVLLLKLVAYDLWRLPMVGRIAVFILLGAVLLAISFGYQRLRKTLFPPEE